MSENSQSPLQRNSSYFFGRPAITSRGPVVVLGPARGGTSMVSGVLWHLGFHLGEDAGPPVFESNELSDFLLTSPIKEMQAKISELNMNFENWAWKRPESLEHWSMLFEAFTPKALIYVFRDPLATAARRTLAFEEPDVSSREVFEMNLTGVIDDLNRMLLAFRQLNVPSLLVSYEEVLQNPRQFVEDLVHFLNIEVTHSQFDAACAFIQPSPHEYVVLTRMIGSKGYLDVADQYVASGWALLAISSEPAVVEIYVNEKLYTSIRANAAREDLSELGLGDCAFTVEFNPPLQPGSRIRARVAGDVVDLVNSPQIAL